MADRLVMLAGCQTNETKGLIYKRKPTSNSNQRLWFWWKLAQQQDNNDLIDFVPGSRSHFRVHSVPSSSSFTFKAPLGTDSMVFL